MKALTYHGSKDVRVESVPDPTIVADDDIILRVTATAICGSDLHIYRGKIPAVEHGDILGHEFMGIVEAVGPAVTKIKRGDRVVIPFTISCGECFFLREGPVRGLREHQSRARCDRQQEADAPRRRPLRL